MKLRMKYRINHLLLMLLINRCLLIFVVRFEVYLLGLGSRRSVNGALRELKGWGFVLTFWKFVKARSPIKRQ